MRGRKKQAAQTACLSPGQARGEGVLGLSLTPEK